METHNFCCPHLIDVGLHDEVLRLHILPAVAEGVERGELADPVRHLVLKEGVRRVADVVLRADVTDLARVRAQLHCHTEDWKVEIYEISASSMS